MSRRTNHPGLGPLAKANGIKYITALQRVMSGWSIEDAGTIPVGQKNLNLVRKKPGPKGPHKPKIKGHHHVGPRPMSLEVFSSLYRHMAPAAVPYTPPPLPAVPYTPPVDRSMPWDRPGYIKSLRVKKKQPSRYVPKGRAPTEDTSPPRIRAIREALCAEFIKTGNLNPELHAKLKEYVDEVHRSEKHSAAISAEPAVESVRQRRAPVRHDDSGDVLQSDV